MTVPSLPSLPSGHEPSATELAQILTAVTYCIYPPTAKINRSTAQTIANSTQTAISFDTSVFTSTGTSTGMVNIGANPTRLTVVDAGLYEIVACLGWAINAVGVRSYALRKNGTTVVGQVVVPTATGAGNSPLMTVTATDSAAAADYYELIVAQDSGGNLNTGTSPAPFLSITRRSG